MNTHDSGDGNTDATNLNPAGLTPGLESGNRHMNVRYELQTCP